MRTYLSFFLALYILGALANECSYLASDGSFYDLSPLSDSDQYLVPITKDTQLIFGVCHEAKMCDAAACEISEEKGNTVLGDIQQLSWSEEGTHAGKGITLAYGGGVSCDGTESAAEFVINFKCDHETEFQVIDFGSYCDKYTIRVHSKYACGQKMENHDEENSDEGDSSNGLFYTTLAAGFAVSAAVVIGVIVGVITLKMKKPEDENSQETADGYEQLEVV